MMTKEQLAEIKARLAAATPGPWDTSPHVPHAVFVAARGEDGSRRHIVAAGPTSIGTPEDAAFIAHAPEDIGAMLAEIERLQTSAKANEEHCAAVERMVQDYMRRYGVL